MKMALTIASLALMSGCTEPQRSNVQKSEEAAPAKNEERASTAGPTAEDRRKANSLRLWQSVGLMIGTSDDEAEKLVTKVLAAHNVVASDENVKDLVGALLTFRDQDGVEPKRVLDCMNSGVRSPTGPAWQDTIAYCVTELAA